MRAALSVGLGAGGAGVEGAHWRLDGCVQLAWLLLAVLGTRRSWAGCMQRKRLKVWQCLCMCV